MGTAKKYLNLDALVPDEKIVTLAQKDFNISKIPLGTMVKITKMTQRLGDDTNVSGQIDAVVELISDVLSITDASASREWVMDNLDVDQMKALIEFIGDSMGAELNGSKAVPQGEQEGNQGS